ncbi:MAG TPA: TasA family protein [Acidimicrobiales bacterium]
MSSRSLTSKALLSVIVLGFTASIAAVGTFASFTGTDSDSHTLSTGSLSMGLAAAGSTNRLATGATAVVPGDTIQRTATITNDGSTNFPEVELTTEATVSSALDTDATDGLQITIDRCSVAWTESGPPYTYTCSGTTDTILAQTALIMADQDLSLVNTMNALTSGGTDYLRITVTLPTTAGNSFQGLTSTIDYTFSGTQQAGSAK